MDDTSKLSSDSVSDGTAVTQKERVKSQPRIHGRFAKAGSSAKTPADPLMKDAKTKVNLSVDKGKVKMGMDDPPLVDVKVTNPVTYFKKWWKKLIGNEGITFKMSLKVKPLTAFLLLAFVVSGGVTISLLNKVREKSPVADYIPAIGSEGTERAFTGKLEVSSKGTYFLITNSDLITLSSNTDLSLKYFMDKKILVTGKYNEDKKLLKVEDIKILED